MRANVAYRISELTRSGWLAAKVMASGPPSSEATSAVRWEPTASITARMSSICSSSVGAPSTGSESPDPRRSNVIRRANEHSRSMNAAMFGSEASCSICETQVGTYSSSGPRPIAW